MYVRKDASIRLMETGHIKPQASPSLQGLSHIPTSLWAAATVLTWDIISKGGCVSDVEIIFHSS